MVTYVAFVTNTARIRHTGYLPCLYLPPFSKLTSFSAFFYRQHHFCLLLQTFDYRDGRSREACRMSLFVDIFRYLIVLQKLERPPESPTTARELDFDDEDLSSSPKPSRPTTSTNTNPPPHLAATESAPPPQPPRPLSPRQQAENTLKEAFPSIDAAVVKAVLTASGGQVEPAFHALLGPYTHLCAVFIVHY